MKYTILTLGCKVNQFETQAMETMLRELGHVSTSEGDADIIIINTCAVTAESGRKSRQAIRRLKNENPGAVCAVCGCFSQVAPEEIETLGADIIYGSGDRKKLINDIETFFRENKAVKNIDDPFKRKAYETLPAGAMEGRTRAYIKIEDGCENFCSYCIIPFARGKVRSMPIEEAAAQAKELKERGYKEIVVTGIEISSYGKDKAYSVRLGDVIEAIALSAPNVRIRLGSIEPTVITEDFCKKLQSCGNICRHFHLSLQSGCDKTLKNMRRKYSCDEFYEKTELLRKYFPGCAITADLITGFPGETDDDHADTLAFIERCNFSAMHIFPYSVRPGTKAAAMSEQLSAAVKEKRAKSAQEIAAKMQENFLRSYIGREVEVLYESKSKELWHGHTDTYCEVVCEGEDIGGCIKRTIITGIDGKKLVGKIVDLD